MSRLDLRKDLFPVKGGGADGAADARSVGVLRAGGIAGVGGEADRAAEAGSAWVHRAEGIAEICEVFEGAEECVAHASLATAVGY